MNFNIKTIHQSRTSKILPFYLSDLGKKIVKLSVIFLLLINLNGCALLGTIIQIVPLAGIFVYYSAPQEIEDGKVICFKTVRTYEGIDGRRVYAENVDNRYYICLVDCKEGTVKEIACILDDGFYELDEGVIYYDKGKIKFALDEPQGTWQLDIDGSNLEKIASKPIKPSNYQPDVKYYAYLPPPAIEDIPAD